MSKVTLTSTQNDLGVQLSPHMLGDYVEAVPHGSQGAAIGLTEGDVITKAGTVGKTQFPVKYYQGLNRVVLILSNNDGISEQFPMELVVLRDEDKPCPPGRPRADSKTSTAAETDAEARSSASGGTI
jgi:hypothetical protein